jgi:hypothetical protein
VIVKRECKYCSMLTSSPAVFSLPDDMTYTMPCPLRPSRTPRCRSRLFAQDRCVYAHVILRCVHEAHSPSAT